MSNYIWVFLEKFSLIVIKLVFMAVAARFISPDVFGVFSIAIFLVNSLGLIVDSGMAGSVIKEKHVDEQDYYTLNYFNVVIAVIISFLLFGLSGEVADYYQKPELALILKSLCLTLIFRAFSTVYFAYLCRELRFAEQAKITALAAIISVGVTLALIWQGWTLWALVVQQILESFLIFVFLAYISKINFFKFQFNKEKFKKHFTFGTRLSFASLIESSFPNIILNKINAIGGMKAVGNYTQNVKVSDLFIGIMTVTLDKVMMPVMAKTVNDKNDLIKYLNQILTYFTYIAYLIFTVMIICSNEIIFLLLGKEWTNSAWMLALVAYCGYAQILEIVCRAILKSQGYSNQILIVSLLKFIFLLLGVTISSRFDIKHILLTLVGLSWLYIIIYIFIIKKYKGINFSNFFIPTYKTLLASAFTILCYYLVFDSSFPVTLSQSLIWLIIKSIFVLLVYILSSFFLGFPVVKVIKFLQELILSNRIKN